MSFLQHVFVKNFLQRPCGKYALHNPQRNAGCGPAVGEGLYIKCFNGGVAAVWQKRIAAFESEACIVSKAAEGGRSLCPFRWFSAFHRFDCRTEPF